VPDALIKVRNILLFVHHKEKYIARLSYYAILRAYVVNVAPYKHGISYGNGWTHVDGWSERIVDYIAAVEAEAAA